MKGKKKNYKFVSEFIIVCSNNGNDTADKIVKCAKNRINEIDIILKQLPQLKKERSNLLDVVFTLDNE